MSATSIVSVVEKSGDRKLSAHGNVSATWAAMASCPDPVWDLGGVLVSGCALKQWGTCYATTGHAAIATARLNRNATATKQSQATLRRTIARREAKAICQLSGTRKLRVHVVGDCSTPETAAMVGRAMVAHERKHHKMAWTYTHAWREVPLSAWHGARVLASCETLQQVKQAHARGYGTSLITSFHTSHLAYKRDGHLIIPCPAQFFKTLPDGTKTRQATCEHCTLCMRGDWLKAHNASVGFEPDANTAKKILPLLVVR